MSRQNRARPFHGEPAHDPILLSAEARAVSGLRLRRFRKHDLIELYHLDQACFPRDIAYSITDLKYFLHSVRCFSLVAEGTEGSLAGFTIVERARRQGSMIGHIVTIDVAPWTRRKGLGRLLLSAAEEQLRREGAALLTLEVAEDNLGAQAFYDRAGFTDIGRIPGYYAGRLNARVMEKPV